LPRPPAGNRPAPAHLPPTRPLRGRRPDGVPPPALGNPPPATAPHPSRPTPPRLGQPPPTTAPTLDGRHRPALGNLPPGAAGWARRHPGAAHPSRQTPTPARAQVPRTDPNAPHPGPAPGPGRGWSPRRGRAGGRQARTGAAEHGTTPRTSTTDAAPGKPPTQAPRAHHDGPNPTRHAETHDPAPARSATGIHSQWIGFQPGGEADLMTAERRGVVPVEPDGAVTGEGDGRNGCSRLRRV
jgi:hypothetical protein